MSIWRSRRWIIVAASLFATRPPPVVPVLIWPLIAVSLPFQFPGTFLSTFLFLFHFAPFLFLSPTFLFLALLLSFLFSFALGFFSLGVVLAVAVIVIAVLDWSKQIQTRLKRKFICQFGILVGLTRACQVSFVELFFLQILGQAIVFNVVNADCAITELSVMVNYFLMWFDG